ncbi:MAG: hypothetical protein E3J35_09465 [Methanomassiliicoccales archaeon]|nr:MAG: hypothetical protein E3J35_09465 [Methanomassiliicoccales archaeon]
MIKVLSGIVGMVHERADFIATKLVDDAFESLHSSTDIRTLSYSVQGSDDLTGAKTYSVRLHDEGSNLTHRFIHMPYLVGQNANPIEDTLVACGCVALLKNKYPNDYVICTLFMPEAPDESDVTLSILRLVRMLADFTLDMPHPNRLDITDKMLGMSDYWDYADSLASNIEDWYLGEPVLPKDILAEDTTRYTPVLEDSGLGILEVIGAVQKMKEKDSPIDKGHRDVRDFLDNEIYKDTLECTSEERRQLVQEATENVPKIRPGDNHSQMDIDDRVLFQSLMAAVWKGAPEPSNVPETGLPVPDFETSYVRMYGILSKDHDQCFLKALEIAGYEALSRAVAHESADEEWVEFQVQPTRNLPKSTVIVCDTSVLSESRFFSEYINNLGMYIVPIPSEMESELASVLDRIGKMRGASTWRMKAVLEKHQELEGLCDQAYERFCSGMHELSRLENHEESLNEEDLRRHAVNDLCGSLEAELRNTLSEPMIADLRRKGPQRELTILTKDGISVTKKFSKALLWGGEVQITLGEIVRMVRYMDWGDVYHDSLVDAFRFVLAGIPTDVTKRFTELCDSEGLLDELTIIRNKAAHPFGSVPEDMLAFENDIIEALKAVVLLRKS